MYFLPIEGQRHRFAANDKSRGKEEGGGVEGNRELERHNMVAGSW